MLTLVTGQPGNGKTLWTLAEVERQRKESEAKGTLRQVYQNGIASLVLPWVELADAREWFGCAEGSLIVIDEAWKPFPVRKQGSAVPEYVEKFATHRHQGFDIFLVTQHPHQLDTFVRKMVGRHVHVVRKFGAERATVYQWERIGDTQKNSDLEVAIKTDWEYPKDVYAWYKSAEVHTVKRDFPWRRFWWFPPLVLAVIGLIWFAVRRVTHVGKADTHSSSQAVTPHASPLGPGDWSEARFRAVNERYPQSAPGFAGNAAWVSAPHLTGCMQLQIDNAVQCRCADESGALVAISVGMCTVYVHNGWFDPGRKYGDAKKENIARLDARDAANSATGGFGGAVGASGNGGRQAVSDNGASGGSAPVASEAGS